jgi:hypothetical protein
MAKKEVSRVPWPARPLIKGAWGGPDDLVEGVILLDHHDDPL